MSKNILYRSHRGSLDEAMSTVVELPATLKALTDHVNESLSPKVTDLEVKPYVYDYRIDWDTHIVTGICSHSNLRYPVGFTNEPLEG